MQYIQGTNRRQSYFSTLEEQVSADNAVRIIDAFFDKLEIAKVGFTKASSRQKAARRMRRGGY